MESILSFATYRPHAGKEEEFREVLARHVPRLRELELITDRPEVMAKSADGTYIEVFEWRNRDAIDVAHTHPKLAEIWEVIGQLADFPPLAELEESKARFANFAPVAL